MEQEKLTKIIAENLTYYRKLAEMTQLEVAERLNYSDKSVSKWEQGNGMPDIFVLEQLAEMYGVTVNDFLSESKKKKRQTKKHDKIVNRILIMSMSIGVCWFVAVIAFVLPGMIGVKNEYMWLSFLYAVPVSFIVLLVLSWVWKFYILRTISTSCLIWTVILAIYFTIYKIASLAWMFFFIGIPLQVVTLVWFWFWFRKRRENKGKEQ